MQYGGISSAAPYIKAGKVRAIAVTGTHRDPVAARRADLHRSRPARRRRRQRLGPARARRATPIELRRTVRDAVAEVMRDPEMAKQLAECGYEPIANTPEEHQAQTARWSPSGSRSARR